jgi:hypothetical protein
MGSSRSESDVDGWQVEKRQGEYVDWAFTLTPCKSSNWAQGTNHGRLLGFECCMGRRHDMIFYPPTAPSTGATTLDKLLDQMFPYTVHNLWSVDRICKYGSMTSDIYDPSTQGSRSSSPEIFISNPTSTDPTKIQHEAHRHLGQPEYQSLSTLSADTKRSTRVLTELRGEIQSACSIQKRQLMTTRQSWTYNFPTGFGTTQCREWLSSREPFAFGLGTLAEPQTLYPQLYSPACVAVYSHLVGSKLRLVELRNSHGSPADYLYYRNL